MKANNGVVYSVIKQKLTSMQSSHKLEGFNAINMTDFPRTGCCIAMAQLGSNETHILSAAHSSTTRSRKLLNDRSVRRLGAAEYVFSMAHPEVFFTNLIRNLQWLEGREVALKIEGTLPTHKFNSESELVNTLEQHGETEMTEHNSYEIFWGDLKAGVPSALIDVIYNIIARKGKLVELDLSTCNHHEHPMFDALFNDPRISPSNGLLTWKRTRIGHSHTCGSSYNPSQRTCKVSSYPPTGA